MLNAEKYKDKIKELDYRIALCGNELKKCGIVKCSDCKFNKYPGTSCAFGRTEWLCSEYKESILTDEAKSYLKLILEPSKCTIIQKLMDGEETPRKYKLLCSTDSGYIAILYKPGTKYYEYFKNMENDRAYTPEELDL